jgi:hypothetical protein
MSEMFIAHHVACWFRFLTTTGKRRTAQFTTGDLPKPSFEALVQKVTEKFPGCPDPKEYEMRLKYKGANDAWVAMKDTDDLVRAIQKSSNKESLSISADSVKRVATRHDTPAEVPSCSIGNGLSPPPVALANDSTVAMRPLVERAAITHVFAKRAVEKKRGSVTSKKKKATSKQKQAKKKGTTKVATSKICRSVAGGNVEHRVLTALAKFMMLKIDNPPSAYIAGLSGYTNQESLRIKTALKNLKNSGKIEFPSGNCVRLSPDGTNHVAVKTVLENQPSNNAEVHTQIKLLLQSLVNGKSKEIFEALVADGGEPHAIAELMQLTGYTNNQSIGFKNPLKMMNELGIIHFPTATTSKDAQTTVQATKNICFPFDDDHVMAV